MGKTVNVSESTVVRFAAEHEGGPGGCGGHSGSIWWTDALLCAEAVGVRETELIGIINI